MHARPVALLAVLALLAIGGGPPVCAPAIVSVSPADGALVETSSFEIRVEVTPSLVDATTLEILINGQRQGHLGGPSVYTKARGAGPPLRDENVLEVRVRTRDGSQLSRRHTFHYLPPKARARRIESEGDRITGPVGQSRLGDWLLANDVARFAIQDAPQRDLHSVGQYGGNVIDAELVGRPGRDSFFEIQPSTNIESVLNAQSVEIVNDGQDGRTAVVRSCGPDDLIDYINASSQVASLGVTLPPSIDDQDFPVEGCTEYRLRPGESFVEITTTLHNLSGADLGLYVGDYLNGMGALEQWTPPGFGVGELLVGRADAQSYFGFGDAEGVDYALVPVPVPGVDPPFHLTTSFTTSGVTFQLQSHSIPIVLALGEDAQPTFVVPANGSRSFTRFFGVGDGSPAGNALALMNHVNEAVTGTLRGCVTVGGAPAPGARVAVGPTDAGGAIDAVTALFVTDAAGCYEAALPVGDYGAAAGRQGAPYEGGAAVPPVHDVSITSGGLAVVDFALPGSARLEVLVTDDKGLPIPARVSVVGFDPSPEPTLTGGVLAPGDVTTGLLHDVTKDPLPYGLATFAYTDPPGVALLDVEPGDYRVYVSRGTEHSLWSSDVTLAAGATTRLSAEITRVLDTGGFISSDYHVHLINSPDSRISRVRRSLSFAGEGVDNVIATEHDALTDLGPTILELGLAPFLHSTVGEEITSFDYGHFNAYPQAVDPARTSGGSTDWARAAPAGEDFPSLGAYGLAPAEIDAAAVGKPQNAGLETVVQVNHIGSHFGPLQIDTSQEPPQSFLADPTLFRLDPGVANFFHPFRALELWNGATVGHQNEFLDGRIGVWMNLLNQGIATTAIADTDTHTFVDLRTAGAATWTPSSSDQPAHIDDDEIGRAVQDGKAMGGQGLYVTAVLSAASTGQQADHTLGGSTLATTSDGAASLDVVVQAPVWSAYDTIELYANAETTVVGTSGGTPVEFGAIPTETFVAGVDFTVAEVPVPGVPGYSRLETSLTIPLAGLVEDTWFVVLAKGTQGTSPPMFPVFARDLSAAQNPTLADLTTQDPAENGVRALGFTNALYLDVDGNALFDAPGVRVAP